MKFLKIIERFSESSMPELARISHIEVNGRSEFLLSGCLSIEDFSDSHALFSAYGGKIEIWGNNFELSVLSEKTVSLCGILSKVEFLR